MIINQVGNVLVLGMLVFLCGCGCMHQVTVYILFRIIMSNHLVIVYCTYKLESKSDSWCKLSLL